MNVPAAPALRFVLGPPGLAAAATVLALIVIALAEPVPPVLYAAAGLLGGGVYAGLAALQRARARPADHELCRDLAAHSMDVLMRLGRDGRILYASPAARDVLGRAPETLRRRSLTEFVVGAGRAEIHAALGRTGYFGAETRAEFRVRVEGDSPRWVEMRCRPLFPAEKAAPTLTAAAFEMVAVLRDITDRKAAEAALRAQRDEAEAANRAKSWFLANMSHELRTPLNAIIGFSEMMTEEIFGPLGNARYTEYAVHVKESGEHLRDLINDVLDVSKIEAGRFAVELEEVSLPRVLDEAMKTVSVTAKSRKVGLGVDFPDGLPHLRADRRALKQMLLNLLSNAVKFTPEGGRVTAAAEVEGRDMVIEVRDTGIGIPENAIAKLARPFEQVAGAARLAKDEKAEKGTGLGLALVKAFAEVRGGSLEVESEEGEGTTARVRLPLAGPDGQGGDTGPAAPIDLSARRVA